MVLKWLSSLFAPDDRLGRVSFPSDAYAAPVDAISALLNAGFTEDEWATFDAREPGGEWVTVQVSGTHVNTLAEPVDLPGVLRAAGLEALADAAQPSGAGEQMKAQAMPEGGQPVDRTLHALSDAIAAELAEAVNAIFRHHFGLPETYELSGYRER